MSDYEAPEEILERSKPPVPQGCQNLRYLMASPFRYGLYPVNSRFRRRGMTPGVFYASEAPITAAAETVWSRLRFFGAAAGAVLPVRAAEFTAFACAVATERAVDLTAPRPDAGRAKWMDPEDYAACLELVDIAAQGWDAGVLRIPARGVGVSG